MPDKQEVFCQMAVREVTREFIYKCKENREEKLDDVIVRLIRTAGLGKEYDRFLKRWKGRKTS